MKMSSRLAPPTSTRRTRPLAAEAARRARARAARCSLARDDHGRFCDDLDAEAGDRRASSASSQAGSAAKVTEISYTPLDSSFSVLRSPRAAWRPRLHDEDVVAELFGLAQDLRGQHDRAAARRLLRAAAPSPIVSGAGPCRSRTRRETRTGVSTMNTFATCTRRLKPPLRSMHLARRLLAQLELIEHVVGPIANRRRARGREIGRRWRGCRAPRGRARRPVPG